MAIIDIRPGEAKPVALSILQSFLNGLSRVFTLTTASTIFLEHFSASDLSYGYFSGAIAVGVLGLAYARADKRFGLLTAAMIVSAFLAALIFSSRLLLGIGPAAAVVAFLLLLIAEAEATLTNVTFWGVANQIFTVRQASRLFGLIGIGEVLTSIAGGLALPALVKQVGVADLLYVSAAGHALAALNLYAIGRAARGRFRRPATFAEAAAPKSTASELREIFGNRYLILIAASLALNTLVYFLVDNTFYHAAEKRFPKQAQLAAFLGYFFVALGVGNLIFRLFLAGRWRTWFGLRTALLTTPACIAVCCVLVAMTPVYSEDPATLFWAVVILKLIDRMFVEGVNIPAFYALFQPLPTRLRSRAQSTMETMVQQLATGLAAVIIMILTRELALGPPGLASSTLIVLWLWIIVAFFVGGEYVSVLTQALRRHRMDPSKIPGRDAARADVIETGLSSNVPAHALYSLQVAERMEHPRLEELTIDLLDHPHPQIVEAACQLIERRAIAAAIGPLRAHIEDEKVSRGVRSGMLRALAAIDPQQSRPFVVARLFHEDVRLRAGAIVGLYRYGGRDGEHAAKPALVKMLRQTAAKERIAAAEAIGQMNNPRLARALLPLLHDRDLSVRRAAIQAAGDLRVDGLWPYVIDALSQNALRADASRALLAGGRAVLRHLRDAYREEGQYWRVRRSLLEIMGRLGGADAHQILLEILRTAQRDQMTQILAALDRSGYEPTGPRAALFRALSDGELANYRDIFIVRCEVAELPGSDLLVDALDGELEECARRVLLLLGFRFDHRAMSEIRARLESRESGQLSLALELLETTLPPQDAARVLPLFEALSPEQRLEKIAGDVERPPSDPKARLRELIDGKMQWRTPWLVGCAAALAAELDRAPAGEQSDALDRVRLLRAIDLFARAHGDQLSALAHRLQERVVQAGETVLAKGVANASLFIIVDGELRRGDAVLSGRGASFGELDVLEPAAMRDPLIAARDTKLLEVRKEELDELFAGDAEIAWSVLTSLCRRFRALQPLEPRAGAPPEPTIELLTQQTQSEYATLQRVMWLKSNPIFSSLEDGVLAAISAAADEQFLEEGEIVFSAGDHGTSMYILLEGQVRVHTGDRTLALLDSPDLFGELAAILPAPRNASVTAAKASHVLILQRATVQDLMRSQREMIGLMQKLLLRRLRSSDSNLAESVSDLR